MAGLIPVLFIWVIFVIAFVRSVYVEARRTSWTLLEGLIAANILGHVIAYPLSLVLKETRPGESPFATAAMVVLGATMLAACMAGGAVWALRRLKLKGEARGGVRIVYLVLGLLLFPSMLALPFNLLLGWFIWVPLFQLNESTRHLLVRNQSRDFHRGNGLFK